MVETYRNEYGETKYLLTLDADIWREVAGALEERFGPDNRAAGSIRRQIGAAPDDEARTAELYATEAAEVSIILDEREKRRS